MSRHILLAKANLRERTSNCGKPFGEDYEVCGVRDFSVISHGRAARLQEGCVDLAASRQAVRRRGTGQGGTGPLPFRNHLADGRALGSLLATRPTSKATHARP